MWRKGDILQISSLVLVVLSAAGTIDKAAGNGGSSMSGLTFAEIAKWVVDIGVVPMLLILFVWFFISRAKGDDEKVKQAYESAQKNIEENNKALRGREDYLLAESAKREEIIRQEAEKRERILRQETEKRESILMASQDRMMDNLDTIAKSLTKMEGAFSKFEAAFSKVESRLDRIEGKVNGGGHG